MAALLCQSFCKLLSECSSCLTLPCRACCDCAGQVICSPFVPYLTVTMLFNVPLVLWGYGAIQLAQCDKVWWLWANAIMAVFHIVGSVYIVYRIQQSEKQQHDDHFLHAYNDNDDNKNAPTATAIATPVGAYQTMDHPKADALNNAKSGPSNNNTIHGHFLDMFNKVMDDQTSAKNKNTSNKTEPVAVSSAYAYNAGQQQQQSGGAPGDDGPANSFHRLSQVLCYDPGVALYFVVAVSWVVWQSVGVTVAISLSAAAGDDDQCDDIKVWVFLSTVCGFLYMMLVFCAFGCSMLCLR